MAETHPERGEVNARILYWGASQAGKSTNLRAIHARLRPDHRGPLEEVPTRVDPSVSYERLGIELGQIAGQRTRIQIVAVPGAAEHSVTRKQLLDRVDGVVFVVDASPARIDDNLASFDELRAALGAYGRSLDDMPLVVQYNKFGALPAAQAIYDRARLIYDDAEAIYDVRITESQIGPYAAVETRSGSLRRPQ